MSRPTGQGARGRVELVGREAERQRLVDQLERSLDDDCRLVLLVGEAGIGKTRLADELIAEARARDVRVVRGDAEDRDRAPLLVWEGVARRLGTPLALDPSLPSSERQWEVVGALAQMLSEAAPVVVVVEDLHWADDSSRWVLERLPREIGAASVLFAVTSRRDDSDALVALHRQASDVITLTSLGEDAVGRLAAGLGATDVEPSALLARTGGVPLFVRELVSLRGADDRLPPVVGDLLRQSLERLGPSVQDALHALAVAGPATPLAIVATALGREIDELQQAFDAAEQADVLVGRSVGALRFRHALLEDAAAGLQPAHERRRLHLALAEAWAAQPATVAARMSAVQHRLAATPLGDPLGAAASARDVAVELQVTGQAGSAIALLEQAAAVADAAGVEAVDLRARLLLELGELRWAAGELAAGIDRFERAAELAVHVADPEVLAAAEAGAARGVNMFVPDLHRVSRLAAAEAHLPEGDVPVRVSLLGRRALVMMAIPDDVDDAFVVADRAVEMARRIGDADLLVDALCDRHQVLIGPESIAARSAAVDEMIALAQRNHRPDLSLRGYEWRFGERMDAGDGTAAREALERLDVLTALMPSPIWRYGMSVRMHSLLNLEGDWEGAEDLAEGARAMAAATLTEVERLSIEVGGRISAAVLWGRIDPEIGPKFERVGDLFGGTPNPFFQVRQASGEFHTGQPERARTRLLRYAGRPHRLLRAAEGTSTLQLAAILVADLGVEELAADCYDALLPYAGRLGSGNGIGFTLPVDDTLGRLAVLLGRPDDGVRHQRDAVTFAQGFPSPPLEAQCRAHLAAALAPIDATAADEERRVAERIATAIGLTLDRSVVVPTSESAPSLSRPLRPAPPASAAERTASLRRAGDHWSIQSPYGAGNVATSRGMEQLARIVGAADREIPAVELAGSGDSPPPAPDLGPALDGRAKQQYRRRIDELEAEIDEADRFNDPARRERATAELDALLGELRRAVGLGGRDRPVGSGAERARVNVTRSLKRAIAAISSAAPDLGAHLAASVQTGRYCSYRPEPATRLTWDVDP